MVLRELFVKLGLDVDAQSFAKGQLAAEGVKLALGYIVDQARAVATEFAAVAQPLVKAVDTAVESLDRGNDGFDRLRRAAGAAEVSTADLDEALKNLGAADEKSSTKTFYSLADSVASASDEATRSKLAVDALGASGAKLVPLLKQGSAGIQLMSGDLRELSTESIAASSDVTSALSGMGIIWRKVLTPMVPLIAEVVKRYRQWRKENEEVNRQRIAWIMEKATDAARALGRAYDWIAEKMAPVIESLKRVGALLAEIGRYLYDRVAKGFLMLYEKAKLALGYIVTKWADVKKFFSDHGVEMAVAALGVAFTILGYSGTVSALKTASAWGLALAKFLAIAGVISALYLAFDDVAAYEESIRRGGTGSKTIYGQYKKQIDEMIRQVRQFIADFMKPNAEDPWWLKAAKMFLQYIDKAYGILEKLHLNAEPAREADANSYTAKALRAVGVQDPAWVGRLPGMTLTRDEDLSDRERPAARAYRVPALELDERYGYARPSPGAGTVLAPQQTNTLSFHMYGSPEENRRLIGEELDRRGVVDASHLEAAAAAIPTS